MKDADLRILQPAQQKVTTAGLAEAAVHRVFIEHRSGCARQSDRAEGVGEGLLQFAQAFGGGACKEGEDLTHVHRAGKMSCGIGSRIAGVDQNDRL